jgi:hypothetical protein
MAMCTGRFPELHKQNPEDILRAVAPEHRIALHLDEALATLVEARPDQAVVHLSQLADIRLVRGKLNLLNGIMVGPTGFATFVVEQAVDMEIIASYDGKQYFILSKELGSLEFKLTPIHRPEAIWQLAPGEQIAISFNQVSIETMELRFAPFARLGVEEGSYTYVKASTNEDPSKSFGIHRLKIADEIKLLYSPSYERCFRLHKPAGAMSISVVTAALPVDETDEPDETEIPTIPPGGWPSGK